MTLEDLLTLTRQRIVPLVLGVLTCTLLALGMALVTPVTYSVSAVAYVRVDVSEGKTKTDTYLTASQLANQKVDASCPSSPPRPWPRGSWTPWASMSPRPSWPRP